MREGEEMSFPKANIRIRKRKSSYVKHSDRKREKRTHHKKINAPTDLVGMLNMAVSVIGFWVHGAKDFNPDGARLAEQLKDNIQKYLESAEKEMLDSIKSTDAIR